MPDAVNVYMVVMCRLALCASAALVAIPLLAAIGVAQDPAPDTVPAAELAPVVVEVFRSPVVLQRVPYSASVVSEDQIRQAKPGLALDEALRGIPGVQVDNRYIYALGERISIRGFGARAQFGVRGVRVLVDGIPATFADGQSALEIIDPGLLGRAEVLRGPASALYGNAAAGVIAFRSPPAERVPFHQRYRAIGGDHGLRRLEGEVSGTSGAADYRASVSLFNWDGFREYSAAQHLRANGSFGYALGGGVLRLSGALLEFDAENPGALPLQTLRNAPQSAAPMNIVRAAGKEGNQRQVGVGWSGPIGPGEIELVGYGITRWVRNPIVPFFIDLDRDAAGARALYHARVGATTRLSGGVDADLQRDERQNYVNVDGEPGALVRDQRERVRSFGPFVQLAMALHPSLELMAALRHDRFRFAVEDRIAAEGRPDDSGERMMAAWSPSVGILYTLGAPVTLFANVATAFETPTTTELANRPDGAGGFNPELNPQRTISYELGLRGAMSGGGYQVAIYQADVANALIPFEVLDVPGRTFFRNAGSAVHRGLEAAGWLHAARGLSARVSYTYTDAVFREYEVLGQRHDGNRVPAVSPHRAEALLLYEMPAGPFAALEARHFARTPADDANSEFAPAYTVVDLRAGHSGWITRTLEMRPFLGITNLFDRRYVASLVPNASAAPGLPRPFYEPAPGRSLYLGLEVGIGRPAR